MDRIQLKNYTHNQKESLTLDHSLYRREVFDHVFRELQKDLGEKGDVTTDLLLKDNEQLVSAEIHAEDEGILAGVQEIEWLLKDVHIFYELLGEKKPANPNELTLSVHQKDGAQLKPHDLILTVQEKARIILKIERTILNLIQRLSGIATQAYQIIEKARAVNLDILVTPTRKTHWGLLDKRAVCVGGGGTHRLNLSDAILVKDNHLFAHKEGIEEILLKLLADQDQYRFIEVEAHDHDHALETAREFKKLTQAEKLRIPAAVMLDNFKPDDIKNTLKQIQTEKLFDFCLIEASGGINPENIVEYAQTGVDIISMGSLTHSAKSLDITLEVKPFDEKGKS